MVSWQPKDSTQARVKGESASAKNDTMHEGGHAKRANLLTKDGASPRINKDIIKSLILVSFILIVEVVVYLSLYR